MRGRLAPRALKDSVRPRRWPGARVRPFNFTVRWPRHGAAILFSAIASRGSSWREASEF